MGENKLKEFMKWANFDKMNLSDFLITYGESTIPNLFLEQFRHYGVNENTLVNIHMLN